MTSLGRIKRMCYRETADGDENEFGFIESKDFGHDIFFHSSKLDDNDTESWAKLRELDPVEFGDVTENDKKQLRANWVRTIKPIEFFKNSKSLKPEVRMLEQTKYLDFYRPIDSYEHKSHEPSLMLDRLKSKKQISINYFLDRILECELVGGIAIACVPSGCKSNIETGIKCLANKLFDISEIDEGRVDLIDSLVRHTTVEGRPRGDEGFVKHRASIEVKDKSKIGGKRVLLMDDVLTSGASINACASILLDHGALQVFKFSLLKTDRKSTVRYR